MELFAGRQVAEVPASLTALLVGTTVVCLVIAALLTLRTAGLDVRSPAFAAWSLVVVLAA
jgi:hypothetical protein